MKGDEMLVFRDKPRPNSPLSNVCPAVLVVSEDAFGRVQDNLREVTRKRYSFTEEELGRFLSLYRWADNTQRFVLDKEPLPEGWSLVEVVISVKNLLRTED